MEGTLSLVELKELRQRVQSENETLDESTLDKLLAEIHMTNSYWNLSQATKIMAVVTETDAASRTHIASKGGIPLLIALLKYKEVKFSNDEGLKVRLYATRALANIAEHDPTRVALHGAIPDLIGLVTASPDNEPGISAIQVLRTLSRDHRYKEMIREAGLDKTLLKRTQSYGSLSISNSSINSNNNINQNVNSNTNTNNNSIPINSTNNDKSTTTGTSSTTNNNGSSTSPNNTNGVILVGAPSSGVGSPSPNAGTPIVSSNGNLVGNIVGSPNSSNGVLQTSPMHSSSGTPSKLSSMLASFKRNRFSTKTGTSKSTMDLSTSTSSEISASSGGGSSGNLPNDEFSPRSLKRIKRKSAPSTKGMKENKTRKERSNSGFSDADIGLLQQQIQIHDLNQTPPTDQFPSSPSSFSKSNAASPQGSIKRPSKEYKFPRFNNKKDDSRSSSNSSSNNQSPNATTQEKKRVKCVFDDDKRFIYVPTKISVNDLIDCIGKEYKIKLTVGHLKFKDPQAETDLMTISKREDLDLCFEREIPEIFIKTYSTPRKSTSSLSSREIEEPNLAKSNPPITSVNGDKSTLARVTSTLHHRSRRKSSKSMSDASSVYKGSKLKHQTSGRESTVGKSTSATSLSSSVSLADLSTSPSAGAGLKRQKSQKIQPTFELSNDDDTPAEASVTFKPRGSKEHKPKQNLGSSSPHQQRSTTNTESPSSSNKKVRGHVRHESDPTSSSPMASKLNVNVNVNNNNNANSPTQTIQWTIKHSDLYIPPDRPPLGYGFFGEVRLGYWRSKKVALKYVYEKSFRNRTDIELFMAEVNILSSLRHPNVILFMGVVNDYKDRIIVTEFMEKGSLHTLLTEQTLEISLIHKISTDIALGMNYLHGENILHRDLTSKNILLNKHLEAKVSDFGLSKVKYEGEGTSYTMGSVAWMAPEVIKSAKNFTRKSDVFSYGVIIWQLFSGSDPCPRDMTHINHANRVLNEKYRPKIPRECPPVWSQHIQTAWAQEPDERPLFEDILQFLHSIDNFSISGFFPIPKRENTTPTQPSSTSSTNSTTPSSSSSSSTATPSSKSSSSSSSTSSTTTPVKSPAPSSTSNNTSTNTTISSTQASTPTKETSKNHTEASPPPPPPPPLSQPRRPSINRPLRQTTSPLRRNTEFTPHSSRILRDASYHPLSTSKNQSKDTTTSSSTPSSSSSSSTNTTSSMASSSPSLKKKDTSSSTITHSSSKDSIHQSGSSTMTTTTNNNNNGATSISNNHQQTNNNNNIRSSSSTRSLTVSFNETLQSESSEEDDSPRKSSGGGPPEDDGYTERMDFEGEEDG
eukprot:TRINITY_DN694_c2_g1_i1.p1 TRINITY_DN694_c2_g1~~TRINITY_DN694_c2_g1_i1.p1  ORF type:complete len:1313 (+),score=446.85 TRINITY_DN694_c2_g1_i1:50-3988(+)